jgi:hypothetical protein
VPRPDPSPKGTPMTELLDPSIREAVAVFLDSAPPTPDLPVVRAPGSQPPGRRPTFVLVGSVAALVAVLIGVVTLRSPSTRRQINDAPVTSPSDVAPTIVSTPPTESVVPVPTSIPTSADEASAGVTWSIVHDPSSIGTSRVTDVFAGPTGFVATGFGVVDGITHGRLWYSADGLSWVEPALDIFDKTWVGRFDDDAVLTATSDAWYVIATPNPGRISDTVTEGADASIAPPQLYRSPDGLTWTRIGATNLDWIAAAGDVLVGWCARCGPDPAKNQLMTSIDDGVAWSPAVFDGETPTAQTFNLIPRVASPDGAYYLSGAWFDGFRLAAWRSTDGLAWSPITVPSLNLRFVGTPEGLMVPVSDVETRCRSASPTAASFDVEATNAMMERIWACVGDPSLELYDPGADAWTTIDSTGIPASPILPTLSSIGDLLVIPNIESDGHLRLLTSADAGHTWDPVAGIDIDRCPHGLVGCGGPSGPVVASTADALVIPLESPAANQMSGFETILVLGTLTHN